MDPRLTDWELSQICATLIRWPSRAICRPSGPGQYDHFDPMYNDYHLMMLVRAFPEESIAAMMQAHLDGKDLSRAVVTYLAEHAS